MTREEKDAKMASIPLEELEADYKASDIDLQVCNAALILGVSGAIDKAQVTNRIFGNMAIMVTISNELSRRNLLNETPPKQAGE